MGDKRILKVGINPASNLPNKCRVEGTLDLNYLLSKYKKESFALSLSSLSRWFLKVKLQRNRTLNLQTVEKHLEKNDAHIAIELFKEFVKKLEPRSVDDNQEINLDNFIGKHCMNYLDVKFSTSRSLVHYQTAEETAEETVEPSEK